jgi:hypothetical protein
MAKGSSRVLAMFLLLGLATVLLPWQEKLSMHVDAVPAAGCHQHGAKPPAPTPSSYRCCQVGHNSALLQSAASAQLSLAAVASGDYRPVPVVNSSRKDIVSTTILSPDPPHTIPLRV